MQSSNQLSVDELRIHMVSKSFHIDPHGLMHIKSCTNYLGNSIIGISRRFRFNEYNHNVIACVSQSVTDVVCSTPV